MIDQYEIKMQKIIKSLLNELAQIYIGKINANVLNKINIEYYNVMTNINQISKITTLNSRTLEIEPWDVSTILLIEKAIQKSDLGINPQNDGKVIRLIFPSLTEEKRAIIVKNVKKIAEQFKTNIRNIRKMANNDFKKNKNQNNISEDDTKSLEKKIQNITNKYTQEIDDIIKTKENEILKI